MSVPEDIAKLMTSSHYYEIASAMRGPDAPPDELLACLVKALFTKRLRGIFGISVYGRDEWLPADELRYLENAQKNLALGNPPAWFPHWYAHMMRALNAALSIFPANGELIRLRDLLWKLGGFNEYPYTVNREDVV